MIREDDDNDRQPLTWLRGYPLYSAHVIVLVYVFSLFVTSVMMATGANHILSVLVFNSQDVLKGQVWRIFTQGLYNEPNPVSSIWFIIDMFMIGRFGYELEKFFGRRSFLRLYTIIYVLKPLLFTLLGLWIPLSFAGENGAFAVFIAFATLYPNVPFIFNVLAKWLAAILIGIDSLIAIAHRDLPGLTSLWIVSGFAFAFVRYEQGHFTLPTLRLFRRKPRTADKVIRFPSPVKEIKTTSMVEMDALLDKIARSGLSSLTAKEHAQLAAGREALLKNKSSGRR